jgi:hypothetical protein
MVEGKFIALQTMKVYEGRVCVVPLVLNPATKRM